MLSFDAFSAALPYQDFLAQYGSSADRDRWSTSRAALSLMPEQIALFRQFRRQMNLLVLAGAWCGDCAEQCPILELFAEAAPVIKVRYLDRDDHPEIQAQLTINGGNRVPVVVFFSEDGHEVARFGEKTLSSYRRLVSGLIEPIWPGKSGAAVSEQRIALVSDWSREVERVQWILRLSPRLRRLHAD